MIGCALSHGSRWSMWRRFLAWLFFAAVPLSLPAADLKYGPVPFPVVNADTWVLIEVWPAVHDITLSAYFMDATSRKNQNLCEATKRSLDREASVRAKAEGREATSWRECYTLRDAIKMDYVRPVSKD